MTVFYVVVLATTRKEHRFVPVHNKTKACICHKSFALIRGVATKFNCVFQFFTDHRLFVLWEVRVRVLVVYSGLYQLLLVWPLPFCRCWHPMFLRQSSGL